jgi:hypothetical protein
MNKPALITALLAVVLVSFRLLFFGSQMAAWKESVVPKSWRHWLLGEHNRHL